MMEKRSGQAMVEFALIFPILVLLIFGVIEASLVVQGYLAVQHAAREAARFAVAYQPTQGACLDWDRDGLIEDGINDKEDGGDPDDRKPYPFCPAPNKADHNENAENYYKRRVLLIKEEARRAAQGLRINKEWGETPDKFMLYQGDARFFGVGVWGYPSPETECNNYDPWDPKNPCLDHPGIGGLPVRVFVKHNVEIADPIYRSLFDFIAGFAGGEGEGGFEYVSVQAEAQMINEGIQVGMGDELPSGFVGELDTTPNPPPRPTSTPGPSPTPTPVQLPTNYSIKLSENVTNTLPDDYSHVFVATVTNDDTKGTILGAPVSFSTNFGSFDSSGVVETSADRYAEKVTLADGQASVKVYGIYSGTATIRAWVDEDGSNTRNGDEPDAEAIKTWVFVPGQPYITVSSRKVIPLDAVSVDVMDHDSAGAYSLLWCVISGTNTSVVVQDPVEVNADTGNATDILFEIPVDSWGKYQLETHSDGGDCGAGDLVAYSVDIEAVKAPPDITISSFTVPDLICPQTVFTVSAVVANYTQGDTNQTFDVDFYVDPDYAPPRGYIGATKQWVSGISPFETVTVTTLMWVDSPGKHAIWGRVDTSDYVEESGLYGEDNNASEIIITAGSSGCGRPAANASDSGGDGDGFESNPAGAYADGGSYARSINNGNPSDHTDRHQYYNFGLDIPSDAAIEGIEVRLDWWLDSTDGDNSIGVELSWDGGTNWTPAKVDAEESTTEHATILGGPADTWGRTWSPGNFANGNFRVRLSAASSDDDRNFSLDWVAVRVLGSLECTGWPESPPWGGEVKPPGLLECYELLRLGGFENSPWESWDDYWKAGGDDAYQRQSKSSLVHEGSGSMRLHASLGSYEMGCPSFYPYLYQTVQIPGEIYTMTTMYVRGQRMVAFSTAGCKNDTYTPDSDDTLSLAIQDDGGNALGAPTELVNGGDTNYDEYKPFEVNVTNVVDPYNHPGEKRRIYFCAAHDEDRDGTWFYLDSLECEVCTRWEIEPDDPNMASISGEVRVVVEGIPQTRSGVHVWAYRQGGQVYETVTIQNGTYLFHNVPPGVYTIYSEDWVSGGLYFTTVTVTVAADERNYDVHLSLL